MGRSAGCSKVGLRRGPWSAKEDSLLASHIQLHGEGQWRSLPKNAGLLRCGKSCRLRWMNYLRPGIKRGNISQDEEDLIVRLHRLLGNRWSLIAGRLPGRTDNEIKNYWNTHLLKKLNSSSSSAAPHKPHRSKKTTAKKADKPKMNGDEEMKSNTSTYKVYSPKPRRISSVFPKTESYDSLASEGAGEPEPEPEVLVVSALPPLPDLDDAGVLYHFSDEVNIWEKVFADYFQLL